VSRQLALDLPSREARGREHYVVSPANALVLAALDGWRGWPQGRMLLVGPVGAGKTHLAHVWAADSGARLVAASALPAADLAALATGPLAVEDAELAAGDPAAETALFHLCNLAAARRLPLLLTADRPVRDWGLRLPDLQSRLTAVAVTRVDPPDDALLTAVLLKLFADRQIAVTPALIGYLLARMDRSFAAARALVAALDARALAEGRPVSRALAAGLLDSDRAGD
jgi:chromosomal replication initiation ATPase DnaA